MGRISVLIPDADEWLSLPVAHCLKSSGRIVVHGLSRRKSRPLRLSRLFTSLEWSDEEFELHAWLTRVDEIVTRRGIDVVMPVSHLGIEALGEQRHVLKCSNKLVQLADPRTFAVATNKADLSCFLAGNDLPHPRTVRISGHTPNTEGLTFPVLAKPPLSSGGAGIRRFENPGELEFFLTRQREDEIWVVQEFIRGSDMGVNVLCQDGQIVASTVQHAIGPSSARYAAATGLEFRDDAPAMDVASALLKKLGWSGVANIDMRLDSRRKTPLILEVNGRYWLTLLGSLRAGVNFPLLACETLLGAPLSNRRARPARYFGGKGNALLSLVGGGRQRVKPRETDLNYIVGDIVFLAAIQVVSFIKLFQGKFASPMLAFVRARIKRQA